MLTMCSVCACNVRFACGNRMCAFSEIELFLNLSSRAPLGRTLPNPSSFRRVAPSPSLALGALPSLPYRPAASKTTTQPLAGPFGHRPWASIPPSPPSIPPSSRAAATTSPKMITSYTQAVPPSITATVQVAQPQEQLVPTCLQPSLMAQVASLVVLFLV